MPESLKGKSRRGFASMTPERQREIARKGGKTAQERGSAHRFTSEEAQAAGRKGGLAVSRNRDHMAEIGRRGGKARGKQDEDSPSLSERPNGLEPSQQTSRASGTYSNDLRPSLS